MFGVILEVSEDKVVIQNTKGEVLSQVLGEHVVFEDTENRILGEISAIDSRTITCMLIGEFVNGEYQSGLDHRISNNCMIRSVNKEEVINLVGNQSIDSPDCVYIGKNITYEGFNVSADVNEFFSNHFAIIGNSGSGKSCTVARLFQNLFYRKENVPINSHFALFDVYGEYHVALDMINRT
jgi:ABC-type glutathione transport system ATPase component